MYVDWIHKFSMKEKMRISGLGNGLIPCIVHIKLTPGVDANGNHALLCTPVW